MVKGRFSRVVGRGKRGIRVYEFGVRLPGSVRIWVLTPSLTPDILAYMESKSLFSQRKGSQGTFRRDLRQGGRTSCPIRREATT